ncbi:MAG: aspartate-semialdehyde dehydrogenase [Bdellovibrionia bacterium]
MVKSKIDKPSSKGQAGLKVAVVGATGAVGKELLSILETRKFPVRELVVFGSKKSLGKAISWKEKSHRCRILEKGCFDGVDIAFFDASDAVSKDWVPHAAESGSWVIDNSSTFRLEDDILLLIPEVNGELLEARLKPSTNKEKKKQFTVRERILAGPNCSTVQMAVALKPIQDHWGIKRVVVSTYQSTSGAGAAAMMELSTQTVGMFNQKQVVPKAFTHQIAFNCIPHIGSFKEDGNTSEEQKIVAESRKILGMPDLKISATAIRVPTFSCHAESINIECERSFEVEDVRKALRKHPGIILQDDPKKNIYPLGVASGDDVVEGATGRDAVYVGRIRKDPSVKYGLNLWVVSDNLRKGAALNAVQMGEMLLKNLFSA